MFKSLCFFFSKVDCELQEVEMEDLEAKLLMEIDSCDSNNPLAVVNYVNDIYSFYREREVNI